MSPDPMPADGCDLCGRPPADHPGENVRGDRCDTHRPRDWYSIAIAQGIELEHRGESYRTLLAKLHAEQATTDRAIRLAIDYAARAGVQIDERDVRDQARWDEQRIHQLDRDNHRLEAARFALWQTCVLDLQPMLGKACGLTVDQLRRLYDRLWSLTDHAKPPPQRPKQGSLFDVA